MSATDELCRSWLDLRWHLDPAAASAAGLRAHDGRLAAFDAAAVKQAVAALRALAGAAEELDVRDADEEIDRTALLDELRVELFRWEDERPHERDPAYWLRHLFDGLQAVAWRDSMPGEITGAVIDRLRAVPAYLDAARATLARPPVVFVDDALALLGGGGELLAELAARCAADSPETADDVGDAATEALRALKKFGLALSQEIEPNAEPHGFALGDAAFDRRLHHEHALMGGAPELYRWALHERDALVARLADEARALEPGRGWLELVARLTEPVLSDEQLVSRGRADAERALEIVRARGLARVPEGTLELSSLSAYLRSSETTATYRAPAQGQTRARLGLAPMGAPAVPSIVAAFAYPGRHLAELHAQAATSETRRTLRSDLTTAGWTLYAMELLDDAGYYHSPADRLFRLVYLLRAVLLVEVDVGLHTRSLTRGEAIDLLIAHLPIDRRTADAEVRRVCAEPAHGLAAAVGWRELRRLRDAARRAEGSAFTLGAFHDRVLSFGGLPVPLIAWGMGLDP